ncbi:MAG: helix-turn-helix domain-containing protein [Vicinamibacterales bacterium]
MQRYAAVHLEAVFNRNYKYQKQIAEKAGIHESTISKWHRLDGFNDWLAGLVDRQVTVLWSAAKLAGLGRCIATGDPREIETMGRVIGSLPEGYAPAPDPDAPPPSAGVTVNVLVPRPDYPVVGVQRS